MTKKQRLGSLLGAAVLLPLIAMFLPLLPKIGSAGVLAATLFLIYLNLSPESRRKPTFKYAIGIFAACLLLLDWQTHFNQILLAMARFAPVMALMVGVSLFRHSVNRSGLSGLVSRPLIGPASGRGDSVRVTLATAGMGVFCSLGTVSIMCAALAARVRNKLALSSIAVRALCSSMYVLPTTVASASVAAAIPHLGAGQVALLGAPLMAFMLFGAMLPRLDAVPAAPGEKLAGLRQPLTLVAVAIASGLLVLYATGQMTLAIAGAMVAGYVIDNAVFSTGKSLSDRATEVGRSLDGLMPEVMLLAGSGLLIFTVQRLDILAQLPPWLLAAIVDRSFVLIVLLVLFPLITVFGVHPLILFGIFFPLVNPPIFVDPSIRYLAWTSMFVMANLLSPASICALLAAASLQKNSRETSYVSNWRFCAGLFVFAFAYLTWLASRV
jgi:hypothetical protein